jgi:hypothetical protein
MRRCCAWGCFLWTGAGCRPSVFFYDFSLRSWQSPSMLLLEDSYHGRSRLAALILGPFVAIKGTNAEVDGFQGCSIL